MKQQKLKIDYWPIEKFVSYLRNPRKNDDQVDRMCGAIQEFGFRMPVVAKSDGQIVDGHLRVKAAKKLGMKELPVVLADELTEAQIKAFRLLANKSVEWAEWDDNLLALELDELKGLDFDLELTGFSLDDIDDLMAPTPSAGLTDEDDVPEPPEEPVTKPGDLYLLGKHRLLCGDSTVATDVERLMDGVTPLLMVTDPPYGVDYDPTWRMKAGVSGNTKKMGKVKNDDRADWRDAWALFEGDVAYVWHGGLHAGTVADSLTESGFTIRSQIIWAKDRFALSRGDYHWQHEPCWYAVRGTGHWAGDRSQATVWNIKAREDGGFGHGTQKPVECMKRPIENNSSPGQAVYDPFLGSGTTLIAAESTGRICYGMEIDPRYCDVIVRRFEEYTGETAKLVE